jgi:cell division protein FtsI/penicillin-binding protein 2
MKNVFISPFRFYLTFFAILLTFCTLGGRLLHLQVWNADKYREQAANVRKNFIKQEARRGDIVDRKGSLLATTRSVVVLGVDPYAFDEDDRDKLPQLAKLLEVDNSVLLEAISQRFNQISRGSETPTPVRWVKLKDEVSDSVYQEIQKLNISAVYGNYNHSRLYPNNQLAAHVLGYVNKEGKPCLGVELMADYYLKGQDGWKESERDGRRREMPQFRSVEFLAQNGLNVELSIDRVIQDAIEDEIAFLMNEYSPRSVSIIVSNPTTGEILAMANGPTFDPNLYNNFPIKNQRNRILTDLYEPGSTFKIIPVGGALNEKIITPKDIVDCSVSTYSMGKKSLKLPKDHHPLGKISLHQVVQKSSNRGAAQVGLKLGANRLYEYSKAFGFGQKTNLGLVGERSGVLHKPEKWDGLTITRLPMGHAVSVTPMQVHCSMSVIANEGIMMKPTLIRRVYDEEGKTVVPFLPQAVRRVIDEEVAVQVNEMLISVVSHEGTARTAMISGFQVAGKTGTTQKIIDGKYSSNHHVASFSGYFPADNPEVVITVVVDEPIMKKGRLGYGGSVAGPSFKKIANRIISYFGIQPNENLLSHLNDQKLKLNKL